MYDKGIKRRVIKLRKEGKTYGDIRAILKLNIPKSTLSDWCSDILLSQIEVNQLNQRVENNVKKGLRVAWLINQKRRKQYLESVGERVRDLPELVRKDKNIAKICAAMLYLGEGGKTKNGTVTFGNSDPKIISLFLYLLRHSYTIDEEKFRCTVQCRVGQNHSELKRFWERITKISGHKFYKPQVDFRTAGKPLKSKEYKGVCRIEYFSADLFWELMKIGESVASLGR